MNDPLSISLEARITQEVNNRIIQSGDVRSTIASYTLPIARTGGK
jgi:hypothetical protein